MAKTSTTKALSREQQTKAKILKSQAFKVLNHLIDSKAQNLLFTLGIITTRFQYATEQKDFVRVRTYEEGEDEVELPLAMHELKSIRNFIDEVLSEETQINELQKQKLRLLNDYDFTGGDDSEQRLIFGTPRRKVRKK